MITTAQQEQHAGHHQQGERDRDRAAADNGGAGKVEATQAGPREQIQPERFIALKKPAAGIFRHWGNEERKREAGNPTGGHTDEMGTQEQNQQQQGPPDRAGRLDNAEGATGAEAQDESGRAGPAPELYQKTSHSSIIPIVADFCYNGMVYFRGHIE